MTALAEGVQYQLLKLCITQQKQSVIKFTRELNFQTKILSSHIHYFMNLP